MEERENSSGEATTAQESRGDDLSDAAVEIKGNGSKDDPPPRTDSSRSA